MTTQDSRLDNRLPDAGFGSGRSGPVKAGVERPAAVDVLVVGGVDRGGVDGSGVDEGVDRGGVDRGGVDRGGVTVEAAMALAVLALVLVACLSGVACVIAQVRCADAAREAARLAGRGDPGGASAAVSTLAPAGATLSLGGGGELVQATVTVSAVGGLLPGVTIRATASAAREPAS